MIAFHSVVLRTRGFLTIKYKINHSLAKYQIFFLQHLDISNMFFLRHDDKELLEFGSCIAQK